jgi:hypothetical protein
VARYEVKGAPGLAHAIADFTLTADESIETALDVGELVYLAEVYASAPDAQRDALQDAIRCIDLALHRLPEHGEIRFNSRRGRAVYDAEPGRFERERLTAYRDSLKASLARMTEDTAEPPHLSEDEARAAPEQPHRRATRTTRACSWAKPSRLPVTPTPRCGGRNRRVPRRSGRWR